MGIAIGNAIGVPFGGTAAVTNNVAMEAELATYISGLATPLSADILGKINTFVAGYKSDDGLTNLSDAYDVMYYLGNETAESSLRNLVKRAHDAVAVNSPTFTPYEGWAGDGISSYIDSNYNPATEADNYALNDASFGVYYRVTVNDGLTKINGAWSTAADGGTANRIQLTLETGAINSTISTGGTITPPAGGFKIIARAVNTHQRIYINKSEQSFARASTKIPNQNILLLACNNATGAAQYFDSSQISFAFAGNNRTQESVNYLTDRFQALMTANGKQV